MFCFHRTVFKKKIIALVFLLVKLIVFIILVMTYFVIALGRFPASADWANRYRSFKSNSASRWDYFIENVQYVLSQLLSYLIPINCFISALAHRDRTAGFVTLFWLGLYCTTRLNYYNLFSNWEETLIMACYCP